MMCVPPARPVRSKVSLSGFPPGGWLGLRRCMQLLSQPDIALKPEPAPATPCFKGPDSINLRFEGFH